MEERSAREMGFESRSFMPALTADYEEGEKGIPQPVKRPTLTLNAKPKGLSLRYYATITRILSGAAEAKASPNLTLTPPYP